LHGNGQTLRMWLLRRSTTPSKTCCWQSTPEVPKALLLGALGSFVELIGIDSGNVCYRIRPKRDVDAATP
jgi:hypothetical protein